MNDFLVPRLVALMLIGFLSACGQSAPLAAVQAPGPSAPEPSTLRQPWAEPVPKAQCGANDAVETGLQGQVPLTDRFSGRSLQGYNCNLESVGRFNDEGAGWQMAWYEDCAYMSTANGQAQQRRGVVVIDAADTANPIDTVRLDSVSMLDPWESLKAHPGRSLLGAAQASGGTGGPEIDLYELSGDCRQPVLLSSTAVAAADEVGGHEGNFSQDGQTYYIAERRNNYYVPVDISDPAAPVALMFWPNPGTTHGMSTNVDGTRGYFSNASGSGMIIGDTSDVQARRPDPKITIVSELYWQDSQQAQMALPVFIDGTPYVIFVDELGSTRGVWPDACANGTPPFGFARIIDISDETQPFEVAKMMLEVHDPANCEMAVADVQAAPSALFGYDSHYCNVDDPANAQILVCSYFQSGMRVFDIRDPYLPREIAYYNPPAAPGPQAGSNYNLSGSCATADWASALPRVRRESGEIWFTSQCNGFQVVRFTNAAWPFDQ